MNDDIRVLLNLIMNNIDHANDEEIIELAIEMYEQLDETD